MSSRDDTAIERLLLQTAVAHHDAFRETDGADPEWPLWYATYLAERLPEVSRFMGTRSELVYWLVRLDREYQSSDSAIPWERYYATRIAVL